MKSILIEYLVYGNETKWQNTTIQTKGRRSASYTIYKLRSGTEYKLQVSAVNQIGTSQPSLNHLVETDGGRIASPKKKSEMNEKGSTVDMMVMVVGVAGGFLVLIIAIVIVCILMRNIQRNSAKKAAENAQRLPKKGNNDAVSIYIVLFLLFVRIPHYLTIFPGETYNHIKLVCFTATRCNIHVSLAPGINVIRSSFVFLKHNESSERNMTTITLCKM